MRLAITLLLFVILTTCVGCNRNQGETPKESAVVVFRAADGRTLTMDELRGLTGTFRYEIVGKSNVPAEAESLHEQARQAGGSGDYKKAITLLEQASKFAPQWPYPVYDLAFTYLLMKDTENARKQYRKTVELSTRGFFTAITALDALVREEKGDLPTGTYLACLSLEWMDDPEKKAETKGILQINTALILDRKGDHDGAVRLLDELALDPASTYATEHLAKVTLANVAKKRV